MEAILISYQTKHGIVLAFVDLVSGEVVDPWPIVRGLHSGVLKLVKDVPFPEDGHPAYKVISNVPPLGRMKLASPEQRAVLIKSMIEPEVIDCKVRQEDERFTYTFTIQVRLPGEKGDKNARSIDADRPGEDEF